LQRHLEASGKTRKGAASDAEGGARVGCWWDGSDCAGTLTKKNAGGEQRMPDKDNFGAVLQPTAYRWQNDALGLQQDDAVAALRASAGSSGFHEMNHPVIAHAFYSTGGTHGVNQHPEVSPAVKVGSGLGIPSPPEVAHFIGLDQEQNATIDAFGTLKAKTEGGGFEGHVMTASMTVRRLTPVECERLQGFPDDWTLIPWRGKPAEQCPDGPRYKALGNSMACNCMAWIGERIAKWEADHA
jgi:site-specific DNA-cytosine methylase